MRFRLGVLTGFAAGYYLGGKAGRERYVQLNAMVKKAKRSDAYDNATDKAKAVVDLGVERAKDFVEEHAPGSGNDNGATGGGNGDVVVPSPS